MTNTIKFGPVEGSTVKLTKLEGVATGDQVELLSWMEIAGNHEFVIRTAAASPDGWMLILERNGEILKNPKSKFNWVKWEWVTVVRINQATPAS